jgi:hypothetical protein
MSINADVAVCLCTGDIVWIHRPFPCERLNDHQIFHHAMISHMLDEDEKAEADNNGYILD